MRFIIAALLVCVYGFVSFSELNGFSNSVSMISFLIGTVILGPALIASLFCIPKSGRNNKRFFRVFNVILALYLFGSISDISKIITPKTITDKNEIIEVTIPGSWKTKDVKKKNALLNLNSKTGYLRILVTFEYFGPAGSDLDVEQYAQFISANLKEHERTISLSKIQAFKKANLACVYQVARLPKRENGTIAIFASLKGSDRFYSFVAMASEDLYDSNKDVLFDILSSLREL